MTSSTRTMAIPVPTASYKDAEDFESDFTHGTDLNPPPVARIYDTGFPSDPTVLLNNPTLWTVSAAKTPIWINAGTLAFGVGATNPIQNSPKCGAKGNNWPYAIALNSGDLRLNPPVYFRRALKLVNGSTFHSASATACLAAERRRQRIPYTCKATTTRARTGTLPLRSLLRP